MRFSTSRLAQRTPMDRVASLLLNRVSPRLAQLAFKPGLQRVNGVRMWIAEPRRGGGGEYYMALGTYEAHEVAHVVDHLPPGGGFIDVGAHIGYFTLAAAAKVGPNGRVIAFEPTPSSAATLRRNVAENGFDDRVTVVEAAASHTSGEGTLVVSEISEMWNTLEPEVLDTSASSMPVAIASIDDVMEKNGWPDIQLIKLDVEGHERSVLMGAQRTLDRYPEVEVLFEVQGSGDRARVSHDTIEYLADHGFDFFIIDRSEPERARSVDELTARMNMPRWQDSLFNVVARRGR
jgi:FkbM family methyltransferase